MFTNANIQAANLHTPKILCSGCRKHRLEGEWVRQLSSFIILKTGFLFGLPAPQKKRRSQNYMQNICPTAQWSAIDIVPSDIREASGRKAE